MNVPSIIKPNGKLMLRGTDEWDQRELARQQNGCRCISFGSIELSKKTRARSSAHIEKSNET